MSEGCPFGSHIECMYLYGGVVPNVTYVMDHYPDDLDSCNRISIIHDWDMKTTFPILVHPELRKNPISWIFRIANFTINWTFENVSLSEIW